MYFYTQVESVPLLILLLLFGLYSGKASHFSCYPEEKIYQINLLKLIDISKPNKNSELFLIICASAFGNMNSQKLAMVQYNLLTEQWPSHYKYLHHQPSLLKEYRHQSLRL